MKLRIRGNSIRIRVSQTELASIAADGSVEEAIQFGPAQRLVYGLTVAEQGPARVIYDSNRVVIQLPRQAVNQWLDPAEVSIHDQQDIGDGECLRILVEKDFTCLAPREGEDDSDLFPNPGTTEGG